MQKYKQVDLKLKDIFFFFIGIFLRSLVRDFHEGHDWCVFEEFAALEIGKFNKGDDTNDFAAILFDELFHGLEGSACGHKVIDEDDSHSWLHKELWELDDGLAIFEGEFFGDGAAWELALLSCHDEADVGFKGDWATEDESSGFRSDDDIGAPLLHVFGHFFDGGSEGFRIRKKRRDVFEGDFFGWESFNDTDVF